MKTNKIKSSAKNEKILLVILGVMAVGALCYLFIISPAMNKNKPIKDEIASLQSQLQEVKHIDIEIENKKNELAKLQETYEKATVGLPKTDKYPQVFKDVEDMAVACGVESVSAQFVEPKIVKSKENENQNDATKEATQNLVGMKYLQVNYLFQNDIDKGLAFVDKLENYDRIGEIAEIKQSETGVEVAVFFYTSGGDEKENYDFN